MSIPVNFNGQAPKIDPANAVMLLIDHQSGLSQTVKDTPMTELCANVTTLARVATLTEIPVITTASVPQDSNGPLIPEIHETAPHAQCVARKGEINVQDNPELVATVKAANKKQLVIVDTITSVCIAFPSIAAIHDSYQVFAVIDASGTYSKIVQEVILARVAQVGMVPMDIAAVCLEIQHTWNRNGVVQFAKAHNAALPRYQLLIEGYAKAQAVTNNYGQLDSWRK